MFTFVLSCVYPLRPMLGVSLNSDFVSSTSVDRPAPPVSSSSPSSITLKPPRIMPLVSPTTPTSSNSMDASRLQPVATQSYSPCYLVDVEVRLKLGCADILLKDRVGVVRKVEGKTAMVHIKESPSYITIPHESLVPVDPHLLDTVKVIGGNSSLVGLIGTLVSFTQIDGEGLVQFLSWSNQRPRNPAQISLLHLGRYSPLSKFGSNSSHSGSSGSLRSVSGDSTGTASSAPRILAGSHGGFKLVPSSSSLSKSGGKTSSSFPMSGLPLSFLTPPSSSPVPPKSKSAAPAHIVALPSNMSSRPAVMIREAVTPSGLPVTYSTLQYGHKKTLHSSSPSVRGGESTSNSNGVMRNPKFVQLPGLPGGVGGGTFQSIGSFPLGMLMEKDAPRKENILLSKIAAMNRNGFFPVSRGGGESEDVDMSEVLERLVKQQRDYLYELTTPTTPGEYRGGIQLMDVYDLGHSVFYMCMRVCVCFEGGSSNLDVKASCVRVSLVCPVSECMIFSSFLKSLKESNSMAVQGLSTGYNNM